MDHRSATLRMNNSLPLWTITRDTGFSDAHTTMVKDRQLVPDVDIRLVGIPMFDYGVRSGAFLQNRWDGADTLPSGQNYPPLVWRCTNCHSFCSPCYADVLCHARYTCSQIQGCSPLNKLQATALDGMIELAETTGRLSRLFHPIMLGWMQSI